MKLTQNCCASLQKSKQQLEHRTDTEKTMLNCVHMPSQHVVRLSELLPGTIFKLGDAAEEAYILCNSSYVEVASCMRLCLCLTTFEVVEKAMSAEVRVVGEIVGHE